MNLLLEMLVLLATFGIVLLASERIGRYFAKAKLPMISGFLLLGIAAGPYILGLVSSEMVQRLTFLDDISLAVIAFAAGSELHLQELRSRFKSIVSVTIANTLIIPIVGTLAVYLLAGMIPFMQPLSGAGRVAVSLLAGAILVARSPSSAIAIVNELRARGPFTRTVLGVIMVSDVVIIILFAISMSVAHVLLDRSGLQLDFILILATELLVSFAIGYVLGKLIHLILSLHTSSMLKSALILLGGYLIFVLSDQVGHYSHAYLPFEFALEPLLICMIGGFVVTNYSNYRTEFIAIIHQIGPPIYIIFFTLTGAGVRLDLLLNLWEIAIIIFVIRLVTVFVSSYAGGIVAGDPQRHNLVSWMTYVTQAGVTLGLIKEVEATFPEWGAAFATMMISTVVISQLVGPPFFTWAIKYVGEAHTQAPPAEFDGVHDVVIFGLEGQSVSLARLLDANGWNAKIATRQVAPFEEFSTGYGMAYGNRNGNGNSNGNGKVNIQHIEDLSKESLAQLDLVHADAVVTMMTNDENYQVCELVYEHYGIKRMIVRLAQLEPGNRFAQLGATVIEPTTAMVTLLDHFVRAPSATSLLLGREPNQRIVDIEVTDPTVHGTMLRELRLPLDVLIISITRNDTTLVSHGYTQLEMGDWLSVVGSPEGLRQVSLKLEA